MSQSKIKKTDLGDLRSKELELRQKLMDVRFDYATKKINNTNSSKIHRKELARVLTKKNKGAK